MKKITSCRRKAAFFLSLCIVINTTCFSLLGNKKSDVKNDVGMVEALEYEDTFEVTEIDQQKCLELIEEIKRINFIVQEKTLLSDTELDGFLNRKTIGECTYSFDGDYTDILRAIRDNSRDFIDSDQTANYHSLDDVDYLRSLGKYVDVNAEEMALWINECLKNRISKVLASGNKEHIHKLAYLKIVFGTLPEEELGNYDSDNNTIVLSIQNFLKKCFIKDDFYADIYNIFNHEINHAFQYTCSDILEINGIQYCAFYKESSAESYNWLKNQCPYQSKNKKYNYTYGYLEERKHEGDILLINFLDTSKSLDGYYDVIFNNDMLGLGSYLGLDFSQTKELVCAMYLMDAASLRNNYWQQSFHTQDLASIDANIDKTVGMMVNGVSEGVVLKLSLTNLLMKTLGGSVTLEENLALYYFILVNIFDSVCYSDYDYAHEISTVTYYQKFCSKYQIMQEIYFEFLSNYYGVDIDEIVEMFSDIINSDFLTCLSDYVEYDQVDDSKYGILIKRLMTTYPTMYFIANDGTVFSNFNIDSIRMLLTDSVVKSKHLVLTLG